MILYYSYGTLDIIDNTFAWGTDGYIFNLGYYGTYCTDINIIDNVFTHNGLIKQNATIWFRRTQNAEANINIIGNEFYAFKGTTISVNANAKAPVINVKYNYFDAETSYKVGSGAGYPTFVYENNYYAAEQKTATSDYGVITSKEQLDQLYAPAEVSRVYSLINNATFKTWDTSYKSRTIAVKDENGEAQVSAVFSNANKQTGTITDCPVVAAKNNTQYVTISGWEGQLTSFSIGLRQWSSSKKFTNVVLEYTVDGSTWVQASENKGTSAGAVITTGDLASNVELPADVTAVRFRFSTKLTGNTQIGITGFTLVTK